jgi:hypothetical protein
MGTLYQNVRAQQTTGGGLKNRNTLFVCTYNLANAVYISLKLVENQQIHTPEPHQYLQPYLYNKKTNKFRKPIHDINKACKTQQDDISPQPPPKIGKLNK